MKNHAKPLLNAQSKAPACESNNDLKEEKGFGSTQKPIEFEEPSECEYVLGSHKAWKQASGKVWPEDARGILNYSIILSHAADLNHILGIAFLVQSTSFCWLCFA